MSVGETIADRYHLEEEIGQGGMATVYRATDMRLHRSVAIKILHPFLASKADSAERFLRESQAIARLHHPNIIEIFDASQDVSTQTQFIVMELIDGQTLQDFVTKHPTHIPEMGLAMTACLCDALEHAHKSGVIHRDIKPENIMFTSAGTIKLMDFGIARILDSERLTMSGYLLGSPAHMAPEIINGEPYTFTCDIFALGTLLYYVMTNTLPYHASTPAAVFNAILKMDFVLPSRRNLAISRACDRMIKKCLECKPSDRYASVSLLREAIVHELQKAGLEDYVTHVKQYYQNPDTYEKKLLPEIVESYNALAQTYYAKKSIPAAIEVLNRILVLEPENEKAKTMLIHIRTARNILRYIMLGSAVLLALLMILLMGRIFIFQDSEGIEGTENTHTLHAVLASDPQNESLPVALSELSFPYSSLHAKPETYIHDSQKPVFTAPLKNEEISAPEEISTALDDASEEEKTNPPSTPIPDKRVPAFSTTKPNTSKANKKTNEIQEKLDEPAPSADTPPPETPIIKIHMTQPVFPYESYAWVKGTTETGQPVSGKFLPDAMGYIKLSLPAGTYSMSLTCDKVCVPVTKQLVVTQSEEGKTLENVVLEFADAKFTISTSEAEKYYYLVMRDNQKSEPPLHMEPNEPIRIGNFARYQNKQGLTIFKIPRNAVLPNYRMSTLVQFDKMHITISAGETKRIRF